MQKINDFLKSSYFLIIVFVISFYSWVTYQERIGICIFAGLAVIILLIKGSTETLLPLLFNVCFISRTKISLVVVPIEYVIAGISISLAMLIYLFVHKVDMKRSKMKLGFFLLAVCCVLPLGNMQIDGEPIRYFYSLGNIAFLLVYVFFSGTVGNNNGKYLSKTFMWLGIFISLQLLVAGTDNGTFAEKIINLGWGGANTAAIYINISIIAVFYLISQEEKFFNILSYATVIIFFIFMICLSLCRAGVVALGACIIPAIYFTYICSKNKKKLLIAAFIAAFLLLAGLVLSKDVIVQLTQTAFQKGLDDNGRDELWRFAFDEFLKHKWIGNGMFSNNVLFDVDENRLMVMHNTFIQCLFSFGIVGMIALLIHYYQKYRVVLKVITPFRLFFLVITLSGFVHGMLDNTYFMLVYMLIICPTLAVAERDFLLTLNEEQRFSTYILETNNKQ